MLDHAVSVTDADRGLLLEGDNHAGLNVRLARRTGGLRLPPESLTPSQTAIQFALRRNLRSSPKISRRPTWICRPRKASSRSDFAPWSSFRSTPSRAPTHQSMINIKRGDFLGVLYLDSRRPAAFSKLDRQILDALAADAASILDNARLVERERERQRMEQEIGIARDIQQALLPQNFRDYPHLAVTGINFPCLAVGGDYFDVFPLGDNRTAFLLADVSGKGLGAALSPTCCKALSPACLSAPIPRASSITSIAFSATTPKSAATPRCFSAFSTRTAARIHQRRPPLAIPDPRGRCRRRIHRRLVSGRPRARSGIHQRLCEARARRHLVFFSDGVTEAMDPAEQLFGVPRLREVLTGQSECALDKLQKSILESVENFSKGAHQADDLTLLIVRYRSTPAVALTETDLSSSSSKIPAAGSVPVASNSPSASISAASNQAAAAAATGAPKSPSAAETLGPRT